MGYSASSVAVSYNIQCIIHSICTIPKARSLNNLCSIALLSFRALLCVFVLSGFMSLSRFLVYTHSTSRLLHFRSTLCLLLRLSARFLVALCWQGLVPCSHFFIDMATLSLSRVLASARNIEDVYVLIPLEYLG